MLFQSVAEILPTGTVERDRITGERDEDAVPDLVCGAEHGRRYEDACPEDQETCREGGINDGTEEQIATSSVIANVASDRSVGTRSGYVYLQRKEERRRLLSAVLFVVKAD